MFPQGPWIKILQTAKNEKKAKQIAQELMKIHHDVATIAPQGNQKLYQIGIFDASKLSYFDKMDAAPNANKKRCNMCGAEDSENRFFKCVNCGLWECYNCGFKRLFGGKIPILHNCGHDNFEMLGNIGPCPTCGEPLGFKSIPQSLRMRSMSQILIGKSAMMSIGLMGCFLTEKTFVEKEITIIFNNQMELIQRLKRQRSNPNEWLNTYRSIKSNFCRMTWSSSYIIQVLDMLLNAAQLNKGPYLQISQKLKYLFPIFDLQEIIHTNILTMMKDSMPKADYDKFLEQVEGFVNNPQQNLYSTQFKEALSALRSYSDNIKDPALFDEYALIIEDLILYEPIQEILNKIPAMLRC